MASRHKYSRLLIINDKRQPGSTGRRTVREVRALSDQLYVKNKSSWVELAVVGEVVQSIYGKDTGSTDNYENEDNYGKKIGERILGGS